MCWKSKAQNLIGYRAMRWLKIILSTHILNTLTFLSFSDHPSYIFDATKVSCVPTQLLTLNIIITLNLDIFLAQRQWLFKLHLCFLLLCPSQRRYALYYALLLILFCIFTFGLFAIISKYFASRKSDWHSRC